MSITIKKNDEFETEILDITHEGFGVAKEDSFPIFIENAIPGEKVVLRITKVLKRFAYGRIMKWIETSEDRVEVTDTLGTRVGTMPLQHIKYEAQLKYKQKIVRDTLAREIDMIDIEVLPTLGAENPWSYRNKAQIPVREIHDQLETGFFKRGTHDLVPIENYHIQDPIIDEVILAVRDILRKYKIKAYDEDKHKGDIRHIIVRRGHYTDEIMVILVTRTENLKHSESIVEALVSQYPEIVSVVQNINTERTNVIMGRTVNVLYGNDWYEDELLGKRYKISSQSFYQVNALQTEVLYQKALEFADITGDDNVIDAYCGIGTISLNLADKAKHVYAVEVVPQAIDMAKDNANINNISNVDFVAGKAEDVMASWVSDGIEIDVIVVDPPRKGLDPKFIEASLKTSPKRIVYVSCNPATLARDLKIYQECGYTVELVQPVDMFPQTTHVETVVLMSRVDK
ncbi:23S rRNA (uracil(1939)-C(5))-methyltransferase RlmD [Erysipelothrix sp. HDW6A]|uniref:23S rRNA (uracil(1939)-C(5))-methyltransferase RlmD n=1 Tax=Erysipelothrix sp. HDW6A TaxID=2714928 RepID=UPI00140DE2BE|nr:23S rRNA (uracil(1939)-C(5))-methyltransferase RlmD [Erysipelothrix sp. HDW6A]QIK56812.1 23S rRNA (uracil(1939)-C(5))-methyltransferase RlmD [Erysipelothrix sp. HDW6A]